MALLKLFTGCTVYCLNNHRFGQCRFDIIFCCFFFKCIHPNPIVIVTFSCRGVQWLTGEMPQQTHSCIQFEFGRWHSIKWKTVILCRVSVHYLGNICHFFPPSFFFFPFHRHWHDSTISACRFVMNTILTRTWNKRTLNCRWWPRMFMHLNGDAIFFFTDCNHEFRIMQINQRLIHTLVRYIFSA